MRWQAVLAAVGALVMAACRQAAREQVPTPEPLPASGFHFRIDERALFLNERRLCALGELGAQHDEGFGADCKGSAAAGRHDLSVRALTQALSRQTPTAHAASLEFAATSPYRLMIEAMFTLSRAGFDSYRLQVRDGSMGLLESEAEPPPKEDPGPQLFVLFEAEGLGLLYRARSGDWTRLGTDCAPGVGSAVAYLDAEPDHAGLSRCLHQLRAENEALSGPLWAAVVPRFADPALRVLRVVSTLRCGSEMCLREPNPAPIVSRISFKLGRN